MSSEELDTAHEYWDQHWGEADTRDRWSRPERQVSAFIDSLRSRGATRVLDVGAGIGRHSICYARAGLEVTATDASSTGLEELSHIAALEGLHVATRLAKFTELPVADESFDHVLAWNVLYHGDGEVVAEAFRECRRVLRAGGSFQLTMLSKRHRSFRVGKEVRPDTFVDDSSTGDKDHPHFYVDAVGLTGMLADAGFETRSLVDVDQESPNGFHWMALAELCARGRVSDVPNGSGSDQIGA
jgi:SAM-dependent methyltransferase